MVQAYAETRIKEALALSKGHAIKARKILEKWCIEDSRLLQSLTGPHMTGILAHSIEQVSKRIARGEKIPAPVQVSIDQHDQNDISFGKELLKNLGMGKPAKFAQEDHSPRPRSKKASQSHINAIHLLAGKGKSS